MNAATNRSTNIRCDHNNSWAPMSVRASHLAKEGDFEHNFRLLYVISPVIKKGYKALRACNHERAYALAGAGGTSSNKNHQIASIWLEASTAVDRKDTKIAQAAFKRIVQLDPDIDSVQQASIECDKIVLGMRQERRELGLDPCR